MRNIHRQLKHNSRRGASADRRLSGGENMKLQRKLSLASVVVALVGAAALYRSWRAEQADASKVAIPQAVAVEVARVVLQDMTDVVTAVGTVEGKQDVVVSSEAAGRLVRFLVDTGDRAARGAVIAEVDNELPGLAVEQAEAQLALAQANMRKAERDLERNERLFSNGDITDAEIEGMRLAAQSAVSAHRSADIGLRIARRQLENTHIKSPISGIVTRRHADIGEMVAAGMPVVDIVDLQIVNVSLGIPEEDVGSIRVGQAARCTSDLYPSVTFDGKVARIGSKAEGNSHRYPVEVEVVNKEDTPLKAGMFARAEIVTATHEQIPLVPTTAIIEGTPHPSVYVVQDGLAVLRPVSPAGRHGDFTGVIEGVHEGDLVVTMGQRLLKDGARVEIENNQHNGSDQ